MVQANNNMVQMNKVNNQTAQLAIQATTLTGLANNQELSAAFVHETVKEMFNMNKNRTADDDMVVNARLSNKRHRDNSRSYTQGNSAPGGKDPLDRFGTASSLGRVISFLPKATAYIFQFEFQSNQSPWCSAHTPSREQPNMVLSGVCFLFQLESELCLLFNLAI